MAYGLKYKSEIITRGDNTFQLLVYCLNYSGAVLTIGELQSLTLALEGQNEAIDAPIVKTVLTFSMVDCPDKTEAGYKHGNWEEFYTPNAVQYKCVLNRNNNAIWTGFVTPDSWSDDLLYRGSVTITARDNIGHISDFEFAKDDIPVIGSNDGMVSIRSLVEIALQKAGVAMPLTVQTTHTLKASNGSDAYAAHEWMVSAEALVDMTWGEVIESVLDSAGLCIRWNGLNGLVLCSVRDLPMLGKATMNAATVFDANFINRSGHRELSPAYKQIIEKMEYKTPEGKEFEWKDSDFSQYYGTGVPAAYIYNGANDFFQPYKDKEVVRRGTEYNELNRYGDIYGEEDKYLLLASLPKNKNNLPENIWGHIRSNDPIIYRRIVAPLTSINVSFEIAHTFYSSGSPFENRLVAGTMTYALVWEAYSGNTYSLVGDSWVSGFNYATVEIETDDDYYLSLMRGMSANSGLTISHNVITPSEPGVLSLRFYPYTEVMEEKDVIKDEWHRLDILFYVRLGNISVSINQTAVPNYFKCTTKYDMLQNLTVKRSPEFGVVPTKFTAAGAVLNGFYMPDRTRGYSSVSKVYWDGVASALPLPVFNALQYLYLHAKPNNILTGNLRDNSGRAFLFDARWTYAGRSFLLQAGEFDVLTGFVNNAMLREFDTYESAIGTVTASDYDFNISGGDIAAMATQKSIDAAASTGGGASGGGGSVSSVNVTASGGLYASGGPITTAGTITIGPDSTHVIPTSEVYNMIWGAAHQHNNMGVLQGITEQKVAGWNSAADDAHTHANKELLDNISIDLTNDWSDKVSASKGGTFQEQVTFAKGLKIGNAELTFSGNTLLIKTASGTFTVKIEGNLLAKEVAQQEGA